MTDAKKSIVTASKVRQALTPPFLVAAAVLATSAVGLGWVIRSFDLFMLKEPLPLRRELHDIPERFGPYLLHNQEPDLTPDIEAVLGAQAYITREYRDTRLEEKAPGALIRLHLAYFTGTPDLILHVPEVCYVAGGAQHADIQQVELALESPEYFSDEGGGLRVRDAAGSVQRVPEAKVPMRVFDFFPRGGTDAVTVAYFFMANGKFMGSPERVRTLAFDIRDRHAYWCKIEVLPLGVAGREEALAVMQEFMAYALPEVLACLPDWHEVKSGIYPPKSAGGDDLGGNDG